MFLPILVFNECGLQRWSFLCLGPWRAVRRPAALSTCLFLHSAQMSRWWGRSRWWLCCMIEDYDDDERENLFTFLLHFAQMSRWRWWWWQQWWRRWWWWWWYKLQSNDYPVVDAAAFLCKCKPEAASEKLLDGLCTVVHAPVLKRGPGLLKILHYQRKR